MPAQDKIHDAVRNALIKDGWTITAEPYAIEYKTDWLYADLRAEHSPPTEGAGPIIVVEIKSFTGPSLLHELEAAFGQYQLYRYILAITAPEYTLYLALRDVAYRRLSRRPSFQLLMERGLLSLIIVDTDQEEIVKWIG